MKYQLKKIKDCRHLLKIEIDARRVEERFDEVFREFQKKARLKGFREGKAPLELVRTTFAKDAEEEVMKSLVGESYYACVRTSRVTPVGPPEIKDLRLERNKNLSFTAEFDGVSDFNVKNYRGIRATRKKEAVAEEDVDKALDALRESRSELEGVALVRPAQEGDVLRCDVDVHKDGAYVAAQKSVHVAVDSRRTHPDVVNGLLGAQLDESREITAEFSEEEKAQGLIGRKPLYRLTVRELKTKKLPELNEVFASGFGKSTVEELRNQIRKDLEAVRAHESEERLRGQIYESLLAANELEIPESLVHKQKERLLEEAGASSGSNGGSAIEAEAADKAHRQVKLFFLLEKIADSERIEPVPEEVEERIRQVAERSKQPVDEIREMYGEDIYQNLRHAKATEFLVSQANVKEEGQ